MVDNAGFVAMVRIGTAVSARMGQLQADYKAIFRAHCGAMVGNQFGSQLRQTALSMRSNHQLVGVGAPGVTDGYRFSAPDQFGAAASELLPAAESVFTWIAFSSAVPAFHGVYRDAVADLDLSFHQRLPQRRFLAGQ